MSVLIDIEKKLSGYDLKVNIEGDNEVTALLGASGCGKSMTLKCIAGIEKPDRGRIIADGRVLFDSEKHINVPPEKRNVGLMFQNYALFPNMTVRQNICAGARRKNSDRNVRCSKAEMYMDYFGIRDIADRLPKYISGGQQQRTALARILVSEPDILLLDEPFSALDSHLRFATEQEVRKVIREFGRTVIMVSHDRDEVFRMADRIAVINNGIIEKYASRDEVFRSPGTVNGAILTGCKNISPIKKIDERHILALDWNLLLETAEDVGNSAYAGIRMHYVNGSAPVNSYECVVTDVIENPFSYTVMLMAEGGSEKAFGWEMEKDKWRQIRGDRVMIHIPPESVLLLR
ncbi:MAG: ATP-binding cassette domain-containing protein [Parasporobacterium sp.]|nr:ATP-binding cassette domain-containing protein [Parasporobacterium sp.]